MNNTKKTLVFIAIEFWGTGDPMFGGQADDRTLSTSGKFERAVGRANRATFPTREAAQAAADAAPKRDGGKVSILEAI